MKYDVNIDLANSAKKEMEAYLQTGNNRVINQFGAFACLYDIDLKNYEHPILVLKTEEPGSKQLIAMKYDRVEGVCYDMIHHLINDCIVMGATPLTVQDAIICGEINKNIVNRIVKAISEACAENGCVLTGGETSEQPRVIEKNTYILTSSIVGIVEKKDIIDGSGIAEGDVVLGLASNGIHTNGYTLVRAVMEKNPSILDEVVDGVSFIDSILKPHMCYYKILKDLFGKKILKGLAHITGGGIRENLNRILPPKAGALIDLKSYSVPSIFKALKTYGAIEDAEMLRTFNMGVGLAAITAPENAETVIAHVSERGAGVKVIGEIIKGNQQVDCIGDFSW